MDRFTEILEDAKLRENYEDLGRGATDGEIAAAEKALGVVFPDTYVRFLKRSGFVSWFGVTLYGITANEPNAFESVVGTTLHCRNANYPPNWVRPPMDAFIVGQFGNSYCWMFERMSPRAGEVALFEDHYRNGSEYEYWKNYEDFLEERIREIDKRILVGNPHELYM
ncbi:MAG: SMI1/KNR4 family protein [Burkholderiales bacterium]|nr:SMI1/KNR4 family protein [Burkholderiales bacterium]